MKTQQYNSQFILPYFPPYCHLFEILKRKKPTTIFFFQVNRYATLTCFIFITPTSAKRFQSALALKRNITKTVCIFCRNESFWSATSIISQGFGRGASNLKRKALGSRFSGLLVFITCIYEFIPVPSHTRTSHTGASSPRSLHRVEIFVLVYSHQYHVNDERRPLVSV